MLALLLHMEFRFGYSGLTAGDAVLLRAGVADTTRPVTLEAPAGITVETAAVHLPSEREVVWRITPRATGTYELRVHAGGDVFTKTLVVSDAVARRSPVRPGTGFIERLLNPSEPPLPDAGGLASITVAYPERPFTCRWLEHRLVRGVPAADAGVRIRVEGSRRRHDLFRTDSSPHSDSSSLPRSADNGHLPALTITRSGLLRTSCVVPRNLPSILRCLAASANPKCTPKSLDEA